MNDDMNRLLASQALLWQLLAHHEEEQLRTAYVLHERLAQDLVVVIHLLQAGPEHLAPRLVGARDELQRMLNDLRTLCAELRPVELTFGQLRHMLEVHAKSYQKQGITVVLSIDENHGPVSVPQEVQIALFRIFEEGLRNAWLHTKEQEIQASLVLWPDRVRLEVSDEGAGFEVPDTLLPWVKQGKWGLVSMRERAAGVGGTFVLESHPGQGTRIVVEVPLSPVQDGEALK
jgi:signal transduction histidine kinase